MDQKKALIYCRAALPDMNALEMQKKHLLAYAEAQGFVVVDIVSESGSGLDYSREGLREVLALVEDGEVDILLYSTPVKFTGRKFQQPAVAYKNLHFSAFYEFPQPVGAPTSSIMANFMARKYNQEPLPAGTKY